MIEKRELKNRIGLLLLAFFSFYLIEPIRDWVGTNYPEINPIVFGVIGIIFTLWMFKL